MFNVFPCHDSKHFSVAGDYLVAEMGGTWFSIVFESGNFQRVIIRDGVGGTGEILASFDTSKFVGTVKMETVYKKGLFIQMLDDFDCTIVYCSVVTPPVTT